MNFNCYFPAAHVAAVARYVSRSPLFLRSVHFAFNIKQLKLLLKLKMNGEKNESKDSDDDI
jgi:hypothetical protein